MSKLNVITNFIDYWTSDEEERNRMYAAANDYLDQDHVDSRLDDVKEALGYYTANDPSDYDKIIAALKETRLVSPNTNVEEVEFDNNGNPIEMWEPLEGYFTVERFCKLLHL